MFRTVSVLKIVKGGNKISTVVDRAGLAPSPTSQGGQ